MPSSKPLIEMPDEAGARTGRAPGGLSRLDIDPLINTRGHCLLAARLLPDSRGHSTGRGARAGTWPGLPRGPSSLTPCTISAAHVPHPSSWALPWPAVAPSLCLHRASRWQLPSEGPPPLCPACPGTTGLPEDPCCRGMRDGCTVQTARRALLCPSVARPQAQGQTDESPSRYQRGA